MAVSPERTTAGTQPALAPGDSPGFLLWRVTLRWQRAMVAALRPFGLTHVQFVLLTSIWWLGEVAAEEPSQRRVAGFAGTDPMMTSQVLRVLEARGLVTRSRDPADSRAWRLCATAAGADLARSAVAVVEAADDAFFGPVPEPRALLEALRALAP